MEKVSQETLNAILEFEKGILLMQSAFERLDNINQDLITNSFKQHLKRRCKQLIENHSKLKSELLDDLIELSKDLDNPVVYVEYVNQINLFVDSLQFTVV